MSKRVALSEAIKAIREAKAEAAPERFMAARFAIACLMSPGQLCNIEAGRRKPTEEAIHRIASVLGVSIDAISYTIPTSTEATA